MEKGLSLKTIINSNNSTLVITIEGHITGVTEVMEIKNILMANPHVNVVELVIKDALVIPSALIGTLSKLANKDKKKVTIAAAKDELKSLFNDLNLDQIFLIR